MNCRNCKYFPSYLLDDWCTLRKKPISMIDDCIFYHPRQYCIDCQNYARCFLKGKIKKEENMCAEFQSVLNRI